MKKVIIIAGVVVALIVVGALVWGSSGGKTTDSPSLTYTTVLADQANGAKIYDVRTVQEYTEGHFKQAVNWPVETIQSGGLPDVPKDTKMYVYCRSGNRSSLAANVLKDNGYTNVVDLGGLSDVQALGGILAR